MTVRVVDTKDRAEKTYETFYARKHTRETETRHAWPRVMQEVGVGFAEMYRSDKWHPGEDDEYKHIVESSRTVYVTPGFLRMRGGGPLEVVGHEVTFEEPMPKHIAFLGNLLGLQLRLYEEGEDGEPVLPTGDDNLFEIEVPRASLGAATHPVTKEVFLVVYDATGVHVLLTGEGLGIEKDGIVG